MDNHLLEAAAEKDSTTFVKVFDNQKVALVVKKKEEERERTGSPRRRGKLNDSRRDMSITFLTQMKITKTDENAILES